jgi:adenine-specific DNA-methyltransferase
VGIRAETLTSPHTAIHPERLTLMAKAPRKKTAPTVTPVESHTHPSANRLNIPTRETAGFADDGIGKAIYDRDKSLDPQLVWKQKNDADTLEVPAVPIYVQEKVHPRHIIDDLKARAAAGKPGTADLFSDFNGLDDFQKKLEFYRHSQHWTNRLILGDSLMVMASLAEKERLRGRVQCVYFDPPYGIKFGSNWQVSTRKRDVKDAKAEDLTRQPEQIKAFRDTWELGIHSYLTYLRDRLTAARDLLTESGSIFVQIGDENVHLVRCLMDEVFGSENWCSEITVQKTGGLGTSSLRNVADYVLWYCKNKEQVKYRQLYRDKVLGEGHGSGGRYDMVQLPSGDRRRLTVDESRNPDSLPNGSRAYRLISLTSIGANPSTSFPYEFEGKVYSPPANRCWSTNRQGLDRLASVGRIVSTGGSLNYFYYLDDFPAYELHNVWTDLASPSDKVYVVQTHPRQIERCLLMTTDPGDLVLDPTCGSGTTAYVAEQWGRRWITTDTSRVAVALARTSGRSIDPCRVWGRGRGA